MDPPLEDGLAHFRLNAIVEHCGGGGVLLLDGEAIALREGDAVAFRPDIVVHEVTRVEGQRIVWSVGVNVHVAPSL